MNINEVARLSGISVRTLHHYDALGLLCPDRDPNGYRNYSDADVEKLQQILFFRECGFALSKIERILGSPSFDRLNALELQRKRLLHERGRIDAMLQTLEKTISASKGDITMTKQEMFKGFDFSANPYEEEARRLYGDEAVDKSNAKLASLSGEGKTELEKSMGALFTRLAALRHSAPDSDEVQSAMHDMFRFFNSSFGTTYSLEAFAGLGELYVADERFTNNIDAFGEGLSAFLHKAMREYANRNE